jgi:hypothetical protein
MRFRSALLRNAAVSVGCASLALFCGAAGCGRPGYMLETEEMCDRLNAANAKENVVHWAGKEIESHMVAATNRPTSLTLTNMPHWVESVDPGNRAYTIHYELDPKNDHVSIDSFTGRGCLGILIGGANFSPDLASLFYVAKGNPGMYAWHSRSDY